MADFTREIDRVYPSQSEVERIMREAQAMRAAAIRSGASSLWEMLQRSVTRKPMARKPHHA